jgi:hypothetical protein
MQLRWQLDLSFTLIQQIRLAHALAESSWSIAVPAPERAKFAALADTFGLCLETATREDPDLAPFVNVTHAAPTTAVGALARPLIFPAAIVDRCRESWQDPRPYRYSFAGLVTEARARVIEDWLAARGIDGAGVRQASGLGALMQRQFARWRGHDRPRQVGDLVLWSSERGRRFPTKAWDADYYRLLASSSFVLCPSGDYGWSYRFFEACLCGAIPVVEIEADAYAGFRYRTLVETSRPDAELAWSRDDAEHNQRLCRERVTVPRAALDDELARLAGTFSAAPARNAPPPS